MPTPVITWMNSTHTQQVTAPFDFGVIDAGDLSPPYTFNIWNNKGEATDVSTMEDCTITTRDMSGGLGNTVGNEVEVVKNNWFHAQVDSLQETDLGQPTSIIGKDFSKPIGTTGKTTKDHTGATYPTPFTPAAKEILGVNNNGDPTDAAGNYATVTLQAAVPLDAKSGKQQFKVRVSYRYV
ncbi:hypothetical protein SAMN04488688_10623 [Paenibacillus sp. cl141a]|uniref:hypothetical protein n=1 Tax=Paenibacillus TaxID=44249 RepID=UPI0008AFA60F|nr:MULTISPECIES: hypothetical protein [Paenibacillus]MCM3256977.1 hypothetical protein [Paenibacillus lautus]SEL81080.1 hypothetical protein SAMN04488688_10623 [Paenibacillus sp. cl141a]